MLFQRPAIHLVRPVALSVVGCFIAAVVPEAVAFSIGNGAPQSVEPRVIEITAKHFAFEPAVVEVTQGESVRLLVKSADGTHGFAIKALKIDKEIERGEEPVKIDFTAKEAGEFEIACSVDCGRGHADMVGKLVVVARQKEAP